MARDPQAGGDGTDHRDAADEPTQALAPVEVRRLGLNDDPTSDPKRAGGAATGRRPATSDRPTLRHRLLPRTLLGITAIILALAVGAAFSGVVLYSYYQYRLNQTDSRVNTLVDGYKSEFTKAEGVLNASAAAAKAQIQQQLNSVNQTQDDPASLGKLIKLVAPSLYFVHTLDSSGQASVGTAFVVSSDSSETLLLTSYTTVEAATVNPAPKVYLERGTTNTEVTVRSWDPQYDLAVIVLPQGNLPALTAAPTSPPPEIGTQIYALSGLGSAGASIVAGSIVDASNDGLAQDAPIGAAFQGGPLVNQAGQVLAVASRTYAPLGFTTGGVWYAPYVQAACTEVLRCPGGKLAGSS